MELVNLFPLRGKWLQCKNKERKLNTKKCLITIVSALLMTAVMHAQEASDLTAEKQLAQRKAELDAREKALNEREKTLAEKERATASSTLRSREKEKAKAKTKDESKARAKEEQARAEAAQKRNCMSLSASVWMKRCWNSWARPLTRRQNQGQRADSASYSAGAVRFATVSLGRLANWRDSDHR